MLQIEVKLYAMLRAYLPAGSHGLTSALTIPEPATVRTVLDLLDLPVELRQLVVVNDQEVVREAWETTLLHEGDRLSVFPPVAGGCG